MVYIGYRRLWFAVVLLFGTIPCVGTRCAGAELSHSQVAQYAKDFCAAIGLPETRFDRVTAPSVHRSAKSHHWRPLWHVETAMGARIEIADVSGIVVGYEAAREPVDAARKDLTEEDVIRIATLARDASGQKTELAESPELTDTGASTGADRIWTVRWRRVCNGVPFIEDEAVVVISGATGKLRSLSVDFSARPPGEFEELTTAQEAVRVATTAVARAEPTRTLQALPPRKVVMIVDGPDAQSPKSSRVVWCCRFDTPSHQKYQAMVDVETGAVLSSGPATGDDL